MKLRRDARRAAAAADVVTKPKLAKTFAIFRRPRWDGYGELEERPARVSRRVFSCTGWSNWIENHQMEVFYILFERCPTKHVGKNLSNGVHNTTITCVKSSWTTLYYWGSGIISNPTATHVMCHTWSSSTAAMTFEEEEDSTLLAIKLGKRLRD